MRVCQHAHPPPGPPSSVQLATTYLDETVRLGKGSRGSLFVFTRGGAADAAGERALGWLWLHVVQPACLLQVSWPHMRVLWPSHASLAAA